MTTNIERKIKKLLSEHKPGTICLASWLEQQGISRNLQTYYRRSGWLESVGNGAFKRPNDPVQWAGGLYALQQQAKLPVHVGAMTALAMQGYAHYVRLGNEPVFLFSSLQVRLPTWFRKHDWRQEIQPIKTNMLPAAIGLVSHEEKTFSINIASPERAMLECLYLSLDWVECFQVMEGLVNLRPKLVQQLLEQCRSIQIKRLFLYMADKATHQWLPQIDLSKINLGTGDRSLVKTDGVYVSKYKINIPKALAAL